MLLCDIYEFYPAKLNVYLLVCKTSFSAYLHTIFVEDYSRSFVTFVVNDFNFIAICCG